MSIRPIAIAFFCIAVVSALIAAPAYMHSVTVLQPNSPPVAGDDSYTRHSNGVIGPLLFNDSDPNGDPMTVTLLTYPTYGSLSNVGYSNYSYTRSSSTWTGTDTFTYKTCDNQSACSSPATVTINIVNQAPTAVGDAYTLHGYTQIGPMRANDYDPDGDALTYTLLTSPAHGTLTVTYAQDQPYYRPATGYVGADSFTYKVCDTFNACSAPATVDLSVNNMPPIANGDFYVVSQTSTIGPFLVNDYDPDADAITQGDTYHTAIATFPTHGNLYGLYYGQYSFVPHANYSGPDSFTYNLCDSLGVCSTGTVYIFILPAGSAPRPPYDPCSVDPCPPLSFNPFAGGLPGGGGSGRKGGSDGDPVDLFTGREIYMPEPDLSIYNPSGPSVVWQRNYLGDLALKPVTGYGSPGLVRGWVHNYDLSIEGVSGSWGALKLVYPNGSSQTMTPQLSGGVPTGAFTTVAGAPYIVTGVSGSPTGNWQSITVTWKDQTKWKFTLLSGTTYRLNQLTNRTGQSLDFSWNSARALTQVSDNTTSTVLLTLAYDGNGRLTTATDTYGRQRAYTFSAASPTAPVTLQSVSQVVTSGTSNPPARWTYSYTSDRGQQLNTITVPSPTGSGNSTATINYDSLGKISSLVDANGNQRVYTYNSTNTQIQVKDAANNVAISWTQKFNTAGRNTGTTDAASHSTTIAYTDSANPSRPTSVTDRNGHVTTYTYDQFGNILTVTNPRSVTTTYTWNYTAFAAGRLTSVQDGSKPATTITYYEPSGLIQSVTRPAPNGSGTTTSSLTYDSLGNVLTVTGPGNNAATTITTTLNYTTDGVYSQSAKVGQPLTVTDNLGHVTHLRFDTQGRVTSVTDALGYETNVSYNLAGQTDTVTLPATGQTGTGRARRVAGYLYVGGPLTTITTYDESNVQVRQVTNRYGLEGEPLSVSGAIEPVTNTYDALYRLKTLKDGNNNTTSYAYNNIGMVSLITMPGSDTIQFPSYDDDGNLLQRIDGNSVVTNYVYNDAESQLTDIQYPASTSLNVHFGYDTYGRRSSMSDGTGSQSYTYGNLDELLSQTTTYTGLAAKSISYAYYPDGSRQTMTTPAGTFSYSYDAGGRASSLTNPFSETTSWAYQNNDWLQTQTLANGAVANYTRDPAGQLTRLLNQQGGNTVSDFSSIAYDGAGNRSSIIASIPGATALAGTTGYSYDSKDQLTQETSTRNSGFTDNFGYDAAGNSTSFKGVTKTYNSNNQQTGTGFVHDGNGNPTTYNGTTLAFDPENRLTAHGSTLTAGYTGDGLRAWKQSAAGQTYFLYDGITPVVELNALGVVTAANTFGVDGLVSRRTGIAPLAISIFYSFDAQGSVAQKTDSNGLVVSNHLFSAHGNNLSGTMTDPFGYKAQVGYFTDNETGLQLLTHRYYDPNTGRFVTRDPIGYSGGINLYAYVANGPISFSDPLGTQTRSDRNFRPGDLPPRRVPVSVPQEPADYIKVIAIKKIADATGSELGARWKLRPGKKSFLDGLRNLDGMGFTPFFNPNPRHFGGSDWEGQIDGNWYHITVGYPKPGPPYSPIRWNCPPSFVDAHYEPSQPSSPRHLLDWLFSWL